MLNQYGKAVMEARRHDRRLAALEDYFRWEYGSTSGMERRLAAANHTPSPQSGLRAFLAKIARTVVRPRIQAAAPAVSVEPALSDDGAEHVTTVVPATPVGAPRPVGYRGRLKVRTRAVLPPLRR